MKRTYLLLVLVSVVGCFGGDKSPAPASAGSGLKGTDGEKSISDWVNQLKQKDPKARREACWALRMECAAAAVPPLVELLKDADPSIRGDAADVLANNPFSAGSQDAILALAGLTKDQVTRNRVIAARGLGNIGPKAEAAVPALMDLLNDRDVEVRSAAMNSLGSIGPTARKSIPLIIELLKDNDVRIRRDAINVLVHFGREASSAIPALMELLKDPDEELRWPAASLLGKMGSKSKEAVPALTKLLADKDTRVRRAAAFALGDIGPEAKSAIPAITALFDDSNEDVTNRLAAYEALRKIKDEGK
jgi:HEAT repeat protein